MRRLLSMPALAAVRCNPDLAAFHQHLVRAGKPPKVTVAAVMRKLLLLAAARGPRMVAGKSVQGGLSRVG